MKGLLFFGAFALLAFVSCKDIDVPYVPEDTPDGTYDEAWYADNATISSTDTHFAVTEEGEGTISFKAEGGSVVVYVDCGTEWTADDSEAGVFGCEVQETYITVTADQNLVEEELHGTITLMTLPSQIHFATIAVTQNAYGAPEITVSTNEWKIPAVAATAEELTTEIGVEANGEWSIKSDSEWLTAEKGGDDSVILTAAENETFEERVAEVVLTCTDGYNSDSETITVTQDARAFITLSAEEFEFEKKGGEVEVTVESNYEWGYAYESDWFTVTENTDGSLTITVDVNRTGDDREGTVTFTADDGAANVAETTLSITQGIEDPDALILEYTITQIAIEIELPIADVTYAEIDWGDGETETTSSDNPSHIYTYAGIYTVSISGTVESLYNYDSMGANRLTAVIQWGDLGLTNMEYAFRGCSNLTSLPEGPGPFENVTTFESAFYNCTSLKEVPEDLFKNCMSATNFSYCFWECSSLVSAPSFKGCTVATTFQNCFESCTELTDVPGDMFSDCTEATTLFGCFEKCSKLTSAPTFEGLSKVTDFSWTFDVCSSLTTVPENMFLGCTAVTTFSYCFLSCSSLKELPKGLFDACTAVTTFFDCFRGCTGLTSLPTGLFDNCTAVTNFDAAFQDCTGLTSIPTGLFDNCSAVTNFRWTFYGCSAVSGESPYTEINVNEETVKVHLYERENYPDNFTTPTNYIYCFSNCTNLDDYNDIPSGWR